MKSIFTLFTRPKVLRRLGFALFILSFLLSGFNGGAPNQQHRWQDRWQEMGVAYFIEVPMFVCGFFAELLSDKSVENIWCCLWMGALALGWLANFTVFFRLKRWLAVLAMAAPWLLFLATFFALKSELLKMYPFYPWACGIGLIHWSRLKELPSPAVALSP